MQATTSTPRLKHDILAHIASFCGKEKARLSLVSKSFYEIVKNQRKNDDRPISLIGYIATFLDPLSRKNLSKVSNEFRAAIQHAYRLNPALSLQDKAAFERFNSHICLMNAQQAEPKYSKAAKLLEDSINKAKEEDNGHECTSENLEFIQYLQSVNTSSPLHGAIMNHPNYLPYRRLGYAINYLIIQAKEGNSFPYLFLPYGNDQSNIITCNYLDTNKKPYENDFRVKVFLRLDYKQMRFVVLKELNGGFADSDESYSDINAFIAAREQKVKEQYKNRHSS